MFKKILVLFLTVIFAVFFFSIGIFAVEEGKMIASTEAPQIQVESDVGIAGDTVQVNICIINNPGIAGAKFSVSFDEKLTLINAEESAGVFEVLDYTAPQSLVNQCPFNWDSLDAVADGDGTILTLTFQIAEGASAKDVLKIDVSYEYGSIYDKGLKDLDITVIGGYIEVIDYISGDVNGDREVNGKDVTLIRRYNADWDTTLLPGKKIS